MMIGYARTSTVDQEAGLIAQQRDLTLAGCEKIFLEQISSVNLTSRLNLNQALEFIREGDTLIVTKLDRLARSVRHLHEILELLNSKGAFLRILSMNIDTASPTGKLLLTIMGGVAEFEREIMLERQREGIAKAKAEGRYRGRKPTAINKSADILRLREEGKAVATIMRLCGVSRASVYRIYKLNDFDNSSSV